MTSSRRRGGARGTARLVLTIAGSDPSGGAGLELDLKVLALHGLHGAAVATCLTLQDARALVSIVPIGWKEGRARLLRLRSSARFGAVKIGMVPGVDWIDGLARLFSRGSWPPIVVDPVVAPTIGPRVLSAAALRRLRERLLPRADLVTPNASEAAALLGTTARAIARNPDAAARALLEAGPKSVLLKGGHLIAHGDRVVVDRLRGAAGDVDLELPRQAGASPRGTGCALASAIAAGLARGASMADAVLAAQRWVARARAAATTIGAGRPYLGLVAESRERP